LYRQVLSSAVLELLLKCLQLLLVLLAHSIELARRCARLLLEAFAFLLHTFERRL